MLVNNTIEALEGDESYIITDDFVGDTYVQDSIKPSKEDLSDLAIEELIETASQFKDNGNISDNIESEDVANIVKTEYPNLFFKVVNAVRKLINQKIKYLKNNLD